MNAGVEYGRAVTTATWSYSITRDLFLALKAADQIITLNGFNLRERELQPAAASTCRPAAFLSPRRGKTGNPPSPSLRPEGSRQNRAASTSGARELAPWPR